MYCFFMVQPKEQEPWKTNPRERLFIGQGAILLCAVLWSTSGLFIKLINWHPLLIAGGRSFLAAIFLFTLREISRRKRGAKWNKSRPLLAAAGGLAYSATMISFVIANKLTASANAIMLQYTAPVWTGLLGWFLIGEKPHWEQWGAMVLMGGGLFVFFREGLSGGAFPGDCVALLSGFFFGANSVILRMQKHGNPADSMLLAHVFTAAAAIPFIFFYPPSWNLSTAFSIGLMGLIQIGLASQLFAFGIKRTSAVQAMLTAMIEPILNPLWVLAVTGERPSPFALLGGGIIIAAVLLSSLVGKRRKTMLPVSG
jgi:drug/metabolite transporter (DMT)-like permease